MNIRQSTSSFTLVLSYLSYKNGKTTKSWLTTNSIHLVQSLPETCLRGSRSDIILSIGVRLDNFVREVPFLPLQIHDCPRTAEGHRKPRFFTPVSTDQSPDTLRRLSNVARNNTWHASRTPHTIRQAFYLLVTFIKETWPPQNQATLMGTSRRSFFSV